MDVIVEQAPGSLQVTTHPQYVSETRLSPQSVASSPVEQFHAWFAEAVRSGRVHEPEAMSLSTATPDGIPSARMVLFKALDSRGFFFYTNYTSRKSQEIEANPHAALVFYWREIHRSVRVLGTVERVSKEDSEKYYKSRPLGSRLGAWASPQSQVIGEGEMDERLKKVKEQFGADSEDESDKADPPCPDFWGGWRVVPREVEFWAGRPSRLHDRVRYLREEDSPDGSPQWKIDRLAP